MGSTVVVSFVGEGGGTGELTWGQQRILAAMRRWDAPLSLGDSSPLPASMTVEHIAATLGFIMSRHPALRTRLRYAADGRLLQEVAAAGEIGLEVVDFAGTEAEAAAFAKAMSDRFYRTPFDLTAEWPVRMAVVRHDGRPAYLVAMYSHLVLDAGGVAALIADAATMDPATARSSAPPPAMPPLEQARWEASPDGQRHNRATLRYWERQLRAIPARRFPAPADHPPPRIRELLSQSPAMDLALRMVAARTGVDTPTVLLAASATALARVTGLLPSASLVMASNRFRSGLADTVSCVTQPGLCVVDVADATFDEAVARAWRASMNAYKNAYCDPVELDALQARIGAERGEEIDIFFFFNDRRTPAQAAPPGPVPTCADVRAALPRTSVRWLQTPFDPGSERFFVHVNPVPDAVDLRVTMDTWYVSPADAEAYVRELEAVAVGAALDPAMTTGVRERHPV
jgi:hypothetical protein